MEPVPVGMPGELYVGGPGVARGYLGRPELTAERFVPSPFGTEPGARLYRTGDRVRWLPSGTLEFLGRLDEQVKLRGFRIELGEIESVLREHPSVNEAVVVVREDSPGVKRLVAYVVADEPVPEESALRAPLKERLPDYMVPAAIVFLPALPLTPNGKLDKRALPVPGLSGERAAAHTPPRNTVEELLASVWAELLGVERVGIHDDFFDLGGHSLAATQLVARIRAVFDVDISLQEMFDLSTVAGLAGRLTSPRDGAPALPPPVPAAHVDGDVPLSFAQEAYWSPERMGPESVFNQVLTPLRLEGPLDVEALRQAVEELVRRHDALRTTFPVVDGKTVQRVAEPGSWALPVEDLSHLPEETREAEALRLLREEGWRPFHLESGPLMRTRLYRVSDELHLLLVSMHHAITDLVSGLVMMRELAALYGAFSEGEPSPLPELAVGYRDYSLWVREWMRGEVLEQHLAYWRRRLEQPPPPPALPFDHPRPERESFRKGSHRFTLPRELSDGLRALARREGVTPFMLGLAGLKAFLARLAGSEDVMVGFVHANRPRPEARAAGGHVRQLPAAAHGPVGQPELPRGAAASACRLPGGRPVQGAAARGAGEAAAPAAGRGHASVEPHRLRVPDGGAAQALGGEALPARGGCGPGDDPQRRAAAAGGRPRRAGRYLRVQGRALRARDDRRPGHGLPGAAGARRGGSGSAAGGPAGDARAGRGGRGVRLISLLMSRSRLFIPAVLCSLGAGAASAGLLAFINRALSGDPTSTPWLPIGFALLALLVLLTRVVSNVLLTQLHEGTMYELRVDLCRRILATPLRRLEELGTPRLMASLSDDVHVISNSLLLMPTLVSHIAVIGGCLAYMAWLSWPAFLGVLAFMGLGVLTYWLPARYIVRLLRITRDTQDVLYKNFRALTEGLKELKLHRERRTAFLREDLEDTASQLRRLRTRSSNLDSVNKIWGSLLFFILVGLLLFLFPHFTVVDRATLTGYTLTVLFLQQPLDTLINGVYLISQGNIALTKIQQLGLGDPEHPGDAPPQAPAVGTFQQLELVDVTHSYHREHEDRAFTLGPVRLTLRRGELVFLVGGNGSGKTTLAKLLTGLYRPESGEIRLNGEPVTEARSEEYRQHFSTVFSDFFLFERMLGLTPPDLEERVREYLLQLQLDRKVRMVDGVLSTTALSQGQRKRLALLTAWLEDRPIYVFDEWAADQDPTFKRVFYEELLPELRRQGRTVVVISHDDRYFHLADRLIRLESGQLREDTALEAAPPALMEKKKVHA